MCVRLAESVYKPYDVTGVVDWGNTTRCTSVSGTSERPRWEGVSADHAADRLTLDGTADCRTHHKVVRSLTCPAFDTQHQQDRFRNGKEIGHAGRITD